ncbi:hypothetical protein DPMN_027496 [Dreissena polymorpha]|uniref:Uncharacterized protein n=1 Tax=Dreissena polymorpha TaxID=45954 RepID=A0A9D4REF6_DREPO|nr:hypothetical protein DPMN_027496 [Dreissena polymorpha]
MATVSHEAYLTEESEIADVSRLPTPIGTPRTIPPYRSPLSDAFRLTQRVIRLRHKAIYYA